jgi:hypothetical protein
MVWIGGSSNDTSSQQRDVTFRDAMRGLGWIDGRNIKIEVRFPTTNTVDENRAAAAEFVALNPDAIVTTGAPILGALHRVTKTVPIVFTLSPIRSPTALLQALRVPAATSPASRSSSTLSPENGWRCSRRSFPALSEWLFCRTLIIRPGIPTCARSAQSRPGWASRSRQRR